MDIYFGVVIGVIFGFAATSFALVCMFSGTILAAREMHNIYAQALTENEEELQRLYAQRVMQGE